MRTGSNSCPTSAATARPSCSKAGATRATSSARCTAGPMTSTANCWARRTFPTIPASICRRRRCRTGTGCCSHGKRDIGAAIWARLARARGPRLLRLHARPRAKSHECNYNWKTFIEVYLEDYHVVPFHPGLGNFVTCDDLSGSSASGIRCRRSASTTASPSPAARPTRAGTRRCSTTTTARCRPTARSGSRYYPNIMVEWYPHVLVVCTVIPRGPPIDHQRGRVLLSGGHRPVRTRIRRGRAGRLHGTAIEDDEIGSAWIAAARP